MSWLNRAARGIQALAKKRDVPENRVENPAQQYGKYPREKREDVSLREALVRDRSENRQITQSEVPTDTATVGKKGRCRPQPNTSSLMYRTTRCQRDSSRYKMRCVPRKL